jgi:hypothetical protein
VVVAAAPLPPLEVLVPPELDLPPEVVGAADFFVGALAELDELGAAAVGVEPPPVLSTWAVGALLPPPPLAAGSGAAEVPLLIGVAGLLALLVGEEV